MTDDAPTAPHTRGNIRGRKLAIGLLAIVGGVVLLLWSFVLPILGIVYVVEKLG